MTSLSNFRKTLRGRFRSGQPVDPVLDTVLVHAALADEQGAVDPGVALVAGFEPRVIRKYWSSNPVEPPGAMAPMMIPLPDRVNER